MSSKHNNLTSHLRRLRGKIHNELIAKAEAKRKQKEKLVKASAIARELALLDIPKKNISRKG